MIWRVPMVWGKEGRRGDDSRARKWRREEEKIARWFGENRVQVKRTTR